jgi:gliding motility-associated lipoprotein GldD
MLTASCDETYAPKPKGYFRIDLPVREYVSYQPEGCPYEFELPAYATAVAYHDSLQEPCWKYLRFPKLNGEIFLSYNPVKGDVSSLAEGARTLAYKHTVKANAIDETIVEVPGKLYGVIYDIGGNAASSIQFYATDSTRHFLRGALYFNVPPQPDSLAPVIKFLRKDIEHLITTIKWK